MKLNRSKFFDGCPVLYPFPKLLIDKGLSLSFKLRDLKFKKYLEILKTKRGAKIAEIGCGDGIFLKRVVNSYQVEGWGLDVSTYSIQRAKKQSPMNIKFESGLAENLPYKSNFFDAIMCISVLEHFRGQEINRAIKEMYRILKPGGYLVIGSPVKNPMTDFIIDHFLSFDPDDIHPSGHKQIIKGIEREVKIEKLIHYFPFTPLNLSLYFVVRIKKLK